MKKLNILSIRLTTMCFFLFLLFGICSCSSDSENSPTSSSSGLEQNIVKKSWFIIGENRPVYIVGFREDHTVIFTLEATLSSRDGDYLGKGTWKLQGENISFDFTSATTGRTDYYTGTVNADGTYYMEGTMKDGEYGHVYQWHSM
ncbi:hypothetical protein U14_00069 [Candidatus Moduliflexus flocculans]|uniref:Lipoprotein n=1 Tax=Candidatus Moduliflexus flocculans TaxID=1499966 RepID=A0A0S6VPB0_9BACT|nr:hypothetical protein U14_00069 [Candidatus Moduliflexus flocculans]